jgi:diacylglycerol kinase
MESKEELQAWKEVKYYRRFLHAGRGLRVFLATSSHLFLYAIFILAPILFGLYFKISQAEWISIVFGIGFVFATEILNTAIEIGIDLTSPGYHDLARDAKDVAAGGVFLSVITFVIMELIIFVPKILSVIQ